MITATHLNKNFESSLIDVARNYAHTLTVIQYLATSQRKTFAGT